MKNKFQTIVYIILCLIAITQFLDIAGAATDTYQVDNNGRTNVIILYDSETNKNLEKKALETVYNGKITRDFKIINGVSASISPEKIKEIQNKPGVIRVEIDKKVKALDYAANYFIKAPEVWDLGFTGSGIKLAILDTGIDTLHPEFQGRIAACNTEVAGTTTCEDDNGHGTAVAGIAVASGLYYDAIGAAPGATILVDKVLDFDGNGSISKVIAGIEWAVANNADVISMSLGTDEVETGNNCDYSYPALKAAINNAEAAGITVVAAAGNSGIFGLDGIGAPACISNVIAVGAVEHSGNIWYGSSTGPGMKDHGVVAGGVDLISTSIIFDGYEYWFTGTSFAAPVVSGAIALMLDKNPDLYPSEIRKLLFSTAKCLSGSCPNNQIGYGRINVMDAANIIDMIAPSIIANTPTGSKISPDTKITVTFSELMKNSSVESAFSTVPATTGSFGWAGNTMTYTPESNLSQKTTYNVSIGTGARDSAGNHIQSSYSWQFTTADTNPPSIIANSPTGNNVQVDTQIKVLFNESMNTSSSESAFSTLPATAGSFSWTGNTMTYTPTANLSQGTIYNVTVGTGVRDSAGNHMTAPYRWEFKTELSAADTSPPIIITHSPTGNNVPVDTQIKVTFNESMNISSSQYAFSTLPSTAGSFSWSGNNMTYTPNTNLNQGTTYNVTVRTDAKDIAGNNMLSSYSWQFVTSTGSQIPDVSNPSASHEIPDDTDNNPLWGETAQLNVTVIDGNGIQSVKIDLSEIGGPSEKPMMNIGGNIWSASTNALAGTPPKTYNLTVNATNIAGKSNKSVFIQLKVMKNGDTTGNGGVNIGDALRCANNVSLPGNPAYLLSSIYVTDVNGNGAINIGDCLRLANNVSHPGDPNYILK